MNESEKSHLSADTIEDAVLGRLTPEIRARVESHLGACSQCRDAFEQELLLAAGIKGWARAAMKQKLAGQIAVTEQRSVPWPHLLGAAALLVVIIGVGVLFRWHEPVQEPSLTFSDTVVSDSGQKSLPQAPAPVSEPDKMIADQYTTSPPRDARETARQDKKDVAPAAQPRPAELADLEGKAKEAEPAAMRAAIAEEAAKPAGLDVWLGGNELSNAPSGGMQAQPAGASNQGMSLNRLEARKGMRKTESASYPVFVIDQRARRALHDAYAADESLDIPTHIVRLGDTLRVTLYLDPLLTQDQMRSVYARQVSPDSFQVQLPGRIVGYKLPSNVTR
jgi:hypothetical protein